MAAWLSEFEVAPMAANNGRVLQIDPVSAQSIDAVSGHRRHRFSRASSIFSVGNAQRPGERVADQGSPPAEGFGMFWNHFL